MPAGRPPKPTSMKIVNGNPGKRPLNAREPQYDAHSGDAPDGLNDDGLWMWNRLARLLIPQGLLTQADEPMAVAWCEAWADLVEARSALAAHHTQFHSYDAVGQGGMIMTHPAFRRKANATERLNKLSGKFGFSPSDRAKIQSPEGRTESDVLGSLQRRA